MNTTTVNKHATPDVTTDATPQAPPNAPSNALPKVTTRVINNPQLLDTAEKQRLTEQFIKVSSAAGSFGKPDPRVVAAWRKIWGDGGTDMGDYHKFVVVEDEQRQVVSFTAAKHLVINDKPVFSGHMAYTLPEYQGTRISGLAWQQLIGPEDIKKFTGGYIVARTPNPIAYEVANTMVAKMGEHFAIDVEMYPKISERGKAKNIPIRIIDIAEGALAVIDPSVRLNPLNFVIKESFKHMGSLFTGYDFKCRSEAVQKFFDDHLSYEHMDGIMLVIELRQRAKGRAVAAA